MNNLDIKALPILLKSLLQRLSKYAVIISVIAVLLIYCFLVLRINMLSQHEPSETEVNDQLKTSNRLKIDQESIAKIEKLEDQNISVQSLFKNARDNPFSE